MPGVPSSRGCDACRRQKKKCDQKNPVCGRCGRLHLTCTGAGKQRYIFVREYTKSKLTVQRIPDSNEPPPISPIPSNEKSLAIAATISLLQVTDLRYDVSVYGEFLKWLPQRLGHNQALDSAVHFMVLAFPGLYTQKASVQALASYGSALRQIRSAIKDETQTNSIELFCAIFLVAVFQTYLGYDKEYTTSHAKLFAQKLPFLFAQENLGPFEIELFARCSLIALTETFTNPNISLTPWFSDLLDVLRPKQPETLSDDKFARSFHMYYLARIVLFTREPWLHMAEMLEAYAQMHKDMPRLKQLISQLDTEEQIEGRNDRGVTRTKANLQIALGLLLSACAVLNALLRGLQDNEARLELSMEGLMDDANMHSTDMLQVARDMLCLRPLFASGVPMYLTVVYGLGVDEALQAEVKAMMTVYEPESGLQKRLEAAACLRDRLEQVVHFML